MNNKNLFFTDFSLGIQSSLKAFRFIFDNQLGHFFIYPILITFLLVFATKVGIDSTVDWLTNSIYVLTDIDPISTADWPDSWSNWGKFIGEKTIALLLWVLMYFVAHKVIKYVVLILMSPVMALLSERTENLLTGKTFSFSTVQFLKDIWRGILLASRNIFVEMVLLVLLWLLNFTVTSVFPPISVFTTPVSLLVGIVISAYFYGFSMIDYVNERKHFNVFESYQFVRNNKGLAIGNGLVFWGLINIPFLGTYIGTVFAPILCSSGAVIALHQKDKMNSSTGLMLLTRKELNNKT